MIDGALWAVDGDGSTPISEEEAEGLLPSWVATRGDLNEVESRNIAKGLQRRRPAVGDLLDDAYLRDLHWAIFGDVWVWAGKTRSVGLNFGVPVEQIAERLRVVVDDAKVWLEYGTFDEDGRLARFHHRLVWVHPFPNGNGRWARAATDLLAMALDVAPFTWGAGLDVSTKDLRRRYQQALQRADVDHDDVADLVSFARS